jgi:hypothetical protein
VAFEGDQEGRFDEERSVDVIDLVVILIVDVEQSGLDDFRGFGFEHDFLLVEMVG